MRNNLKKCDICKKNVKDGHLSRHRKSCLRKWERTDRATCLYCNQRFTRGQNLRRHLKMNSCGAREYIKAQRAAAPGEKVAKPTPSKHSRKEREFENAIEIPPQKENGRTHDGSDTDN